MLSYQKHISSLVKLGTPIIIAQLGMVVMGLADTFMVGRYGTSELAAAGFINANMGLVIVFGLGFSYGLTPLVGMRFGQSDIPGVARAIRGGWVANSVMALLLCAIMIVFYAFLHCFGQPKELLPLMRPYLLTQIISIPFILWFNVMKQFSDGVSDTRTSMWVMLLGNVTNILGNWILIYGNLGFPELGLKGAGLATCFSRALTALVFIWIFFRTNHYEIYRKAYKVASFVRTDFVRLNKMGWPIALQMGMEAASFSLCTIFLGWIGACALAANQIMSSVSSLCFMIYYGIGAAVAIRVSHFHGTGDFKNVKRVATSGMILVFLSGIIMSVFVFSIRHLLGRFTDDLEVERILLTLILPFLLYQLGDSIQTNYANALRGVGDVKPLIWYAFIAYVLVSLPASYIFGVVLEGGAQGVWFGFPIGLTVAAVLFLFRFYYGRRRSDEMK